MFVRDRMSSPAVTVTPDTPCQDALQLMGDHQLRLLPVLNHGGKLVGIVSKDDLPSTSPSPAVRLSAFEQHYLLRNLQIREVMNEVVICTTPDAPVEEVARLMVNNKVSGLPVVDDLGHVVGVITETDIFETFVEMFGGGHPGLRLTLTIPERRDVLLELCKAVFDQGASFVSVGTYHDAVSGGRGLIIKVQDASRDQLMDTLEALGDHVVDAREVH